MTIKMTLQKITSHLQLWLNVAGLSRFRWSSELKLVHLERYTVVKSHGPILPLCAKDSISE